MLALGYVEFHCLGKMFAHEYMEIVQQGENGCLEKNNPLICMVQMRGMWW